MPILLLAAFCLTFLAALPVILHASEAVRPGTYFLILAIVLVSVPVIVLAVTYLYFFIGVATGAMALV